MTTFSPLSLVAALALSLCAALPAAAETGGKLRLTGGVSSIDGAAGGGLTPWAVIGGNATDDGVGGSAYLTRLRTDGYALSAYGAAIGWQDRLEISLARQDFDTRATGTALGLPGLHLKQDILGLKLRVAGDAVLDADTWMPQIALGLESKRLDAGGLKGTLTSLGAKRSGQDVYLSATKLVLERGLLLNLTLRATQANQNGLLGFGASGYSLQPEVSVAWLLRRDLVVGAEYRAKPDRLNPSALGAGLKEDDWSDIFVAWAPHPQASLTLAWVNLGHVVPAAQSQRQRGAYASLQLSF
jgi:hypothetical protein